MRFFDRNEAGSLLANKLDVKNISNPLVVAIPRGGIPVAIPIARKLNAELKLSMTRKIGYPGHEEFAIGAVSLNRLLLSSKEQTEKKYIETAIEKERRRIREMIRIFDHEIDEEVVNDKTILLIDDGIATGKTMELAIHDIKEMHPKKIMICTPVCSIQAYDNLYNKVDNITSLIKPVSFSGVGSYYEHFDQLTDNEIVRQLRKGSNLCQKTEH